MRKSKDVRDAWHLRKDVKIVNSHHTFCRNRLNTLTSQSAVNAVSSIPIVTRCDPEAAFGGIGNCIAPALVSSAFSIAEIGWT